MAVPTVITTDSLRGSEGIRKSKNSKISENLGKFLIGQQATAGVSCRPCLESHRGKEGCKAHQEGRFWPAGCFWPLGRRGGFRPPGQRSGRQSQCRRRGRRSIAHQILPRRVTEVWG